LFDVKAAKLHLSEKGPEKKKKKKKKSTKMSDEPVPMDAEAAESPYDVNAELLAAVRYDDPASDVTALLDAGADVNHADEHGKTALHAACGNGAAGLAELLLARGALPAARNAAGATPLHWAALNGHLECCKLLVPALVAAGEPVDAKNADGHGPVWLATRGSHEEVALFLMGAMEVDDEEIDGLRGEVAADEAAEIEAGLPDGDNTADDGGKEDAK
jgi:ankyrin repeat protein